MERVQLPTVDEYKSNGSRYFWFKPFPRDESKFVCDLGKGSCYKIISNEFVEVNYHFEKNNPERARYVRCVDGTGKVSLGRMILETFTGPEPTPAIENGTEVRYRCVHKDSLKDDRNVFWGLPKDVTASARKRPGWETQMKKLYTAGRKALEEYAQVVGIRYRKFTYKEQCWIQKNTHGTLLARKNQFEAEFGKTISQTTIHKILAKDLSRKFSEKHKTWVREKTEGTLNDRKKQFELFFKISISISTISKFLK